MAARAIWKGVLVIGDERLAVKLYSAVQDRAVHFRMLHEEDHVPVKQRLVEQETEEAVDYSSTQRAFMTPERDLVTLKSEELQALEPPPSRDIELLRFVPAGAIDHRWYERPYYLGPDANATEYAALIEAMQDMKREGVARWTMRKKEYRGALRVHADCLMLITLRSAEEVIVASELGPPPGKEIDEREIAMAQQLLSILEAPFEVEQYRDEYRERVLELVEAKAKGKTMRRPTPQRQRAEGDLMKALKESLSAERKRA